MTVYFNTLFGLWALTKYVILNYSPLLTECNWTALALLGNCAFLISPFFSCVTVQRLSFRFTSSVSHGSFSLPSQILPLLKDLGRGKRGWWFRVLKLWGPRACLNCLSVVFSLSIHDNSVFSHKYLQMGVCSVFRTSGFVCLQHWFVASLLNREGNFKKTYCHMCTG